MIPKVDVITLSGGDSVIEKYTENYCYRADPEWFFVRNNFSELFILEFK